jgi:hypothetical protein
MAEIVPGLARGIEKLHRKDELSSRLVTVLWFCPSCGPDHLYRNAGGMSRFPALFDLMGLDTFFLNDPGDDTPF